MAQRVPPEPRDVIDRCPVCGGKLEPVYVRDDLKVCLCTECMTSLSIPNEAWDIARRKREMTP